MYLARRFCLIAFGVLVGAGAAQAQVYKLLPDDTELVITVNLQQMLKSEVAKANKTLLDVGKQLLQDKIDDNPISKYLKKANFDLLTDMHRITASMPAGRDFGEGVIIIEGKFDADKIEAAATEASKDANDSAFKVIEISGAKAFQVTPKEDQKTIYAGVLDKKTMIVCTSKKDFATAVERLGGSGQANFKAEFKNVVKSLSAKNSISIAATSAAMLKLADRAPDGVGDKVEQGKEFLKMVDAFAGSLTIEKNIDFQATVGAKDAPTATSFVNAVNLFIGIAKGKLAEGVKNEDEKAIAAMTIMRSIQVTATGSTFSIRGQIPFDTLEKIIQNIPGLPGN